MLAHGDRSYGGQEHRYFGTPRLSARARHIRFWSYSETHVVPLKHGTLIFPLLSKSLAYRGSSRGLLDMENGGGMIFVL